MEPMASVGLKAARIASQHITRCYDRPDLIKIFEKTNQLSTNVNSEVKIIITEFLREKYPDHSFNGKEIETEGNSAKYQWLIEPISGTENFVRQIPHFSVSIACFSAGRLAHAIIVDPMRQEEFVASRGNGASLNGKRIRVTQTIDLGDSLVASPVRGGDSNCQLCQHLSTIGTARQQTGSVALDLAYVAAGKIDALWASNNGAQEIAAGCLLVSEAGGICGDFHGGIDHLKSGDIVSGTPKCFKELSSLTRKFLT